MENGLEGRARAKAWIESGELAVILLDSTAEAIYAIDMLGNCTFCNAACLRLLGYKDPIELIGNKIHHWLLIPSDSPTFETEALHACDLLLHHDPRLGRIPKSRR